MEVKGCTQAQDGVGKFPDAPTARGAKHLRELSGAISGGFRPMIAFVIMLRSVEVVEPNSAIDPQFAEEYSRATAAGVATAFIPCDCTADSVVLR